MAPTTSGNILASPVCMRFKYRKPPLYEAICEFYFKSQSSNPALFQRFEDSFRELIGTPELRSEPYVQQAIVYNDAGRASVENVSLHRFWRSDSSFVTLGNDVLTIHQKRPYTGWEEFLPFVLNVMRCATEARPSELEQVVLRYDNRLEWNESRVHLAKWLEIQPALGESLGPHVGAFSLSVLIPQNGNYVQVELSSDEQEELVNARFWLNLSHVSVEEQIEGDLESLLQRAHESIEATFEACIKQALRETFEPEGGEINNDNES